MSIGGWSMSNGFHETAASDSSRKIFAKGVVKLFKQFPMFSEVDIDWEYPNAEGAGNPTARKMVKTMRYLLPNCVSSWILPA